MFNNRRQSRDSRLIDYLISISNGTTIYAETYSIPLFKKANMKNVKFFERELNKAAILQHEYVLIEDPDLIKNHQFEEVILCKWNRDYPSDKFFELNMDDYVLLKTENFVGSSHDEIAIEFYQMKG